MADCGAGILVGGGAAVLLDSAAASNSERVALTVSAPFGNTWLAVAKETAAFGGGWKLAAYAICAPAN
jgi:hypothetical protein